MFIMTTSCGISDKEIEQHHRAELLYQYYADGNTEILEYSNAKTQTQLVDFLCYCATKWLHIESVYDFRHVVGALFAWLIIVVMGSFLMNLFSWRAAFIGGLMLALSPHFFGQSFGNLADISFTFCYILAIHQIGILIGELPVLKWKRLVFIVLSIAAANSMIPVFIVGMFFKDKVEALFGEGLLLVGIMLLVTALLLALTKFVKFKESKPVGYLSAFIIGIAQAVAVLPGLSRSGTTIATGLLLGVKKEEVAQFSFLMVIIPILGECFLDLIGGNLFNAQQSVTNSPL